MWVMMSGRRTVTLVVGDTAIARHVTGGINAAFSSSGINEFEYAEVCSRSKKREYYLFWLCLSCNNNYGVFKISYAFNQSTVVCQ